MRTPQRIERGFGVNLACADIVAILGEQKGLTPPRWGIGSLVAEQGGLEMNLYNWLSLAFGSTKHADHSPRAWWRYPGIDGKRHVDLKRAGTKLCNGIIAAYLPLALASCGGSGRRPLALRK